MVVYQHTAYQPKGAIDFIRFVKDGDDGLSVDSQVIVEPRLMPVLFDYKDELTNVENMVTIITKTFMRFKQFKTLMESVRLYTGVFEKFWFFSEFHDFFYFWSKKTSVIPNLYSRDRFSRYLKARNHFKRHYNSRNLFQTPGSTTLKSA